MPLVIENNYDRVSLMDLVRLHKQGYSVLKSPHVGNQHPSNLVCAALGIPLEMVSFTHGQRDTNFHPCVRIEGGEQVELCAADTWTQFGSTPCGQSLTEYHQAAVKRVFPHLEVLTDMQRMQAYPTLAAMVLMVTNRVMKGVWYRKVSAIGEVSQRSVRALDQSQLETEVFQFSNDQCGWVVPNRVHMIFDFVYQALSSGRDVIYHLSGPQMLHYIGELQTELEIMYDAVRQYIPELPLVLRLRVVPVASARFVTHRANRAVMESVDEWLWSMDHEVIDPSWCGTLVEQVPEIITPITTGTCMSQYDLSTADDVYLASWMLDTPLRTVNHVHAHMTNIACSLAAE